MLALMVSDLLTLVGFRKEGGASCLVSVISSDPLGIQEIVGSHV